ncbi:MAG: hypothetical protein WB037_03360, partial [Pseudolabrys sp.]
ASFDQQAEHIETVVLRQRGQNSHGIPLLHISMIIEMMGKRQVMFVSARSSSSLRPSLPP